MHVDISITIRYVTICFRINNVHYLFNFFFRFFCKVVGDPGAPRRVNLSIAVDALRGVPRRSSTAIEISTLRGYLNYIYI